MPAMGCRIAPLARDVSRPCRVTESGGTACGWGGGAAGYAYFGRTCQGGGVRSGGRAVGSLGVAGGCISGGRGGSCGHDELRGADGCVPG